MKIPECREKLLDAKNKMSDTADMYQKDYIDRVEDRYSYTADPLSAVVFYSGNLFLIQSSTGPKLTLSLFQTNVNR